jgi:site-specific recombinase XerD
MIERWSITIEDAYSMFLLDGEARRFSAATLEFYRFKLGGFIAWCERQGLTRVTDITAHHIRQYLVELQQQNKSGWTVHGTARSIRTFCYFLVREELLDESPMRRVKMPKLDKTLLPAFSRAQVDTLLRACKTDRERALVLVLLDTGLRASELAGLDIQHANAKTGAITVRQGKGRKDRIVYLGARTRKALLRYLAERSHHTPLAETTPLFASAKTGKRLTRSGLEQFTRRLGRLANVHPCTPHMFRRTFALWSLRAGMNVYALAALMGHEDIVVLRRYLNLVEQDTQEAHARHGAVDTMLA